MKKLAVIVCRVGTWAVVFALVAPVSAGEVFRCKSCGPGWGGMSTPYGDTGCGPRYSGVKHEPGCPDPCDACNRWRGGNGVTQGPEMLAPWQMPPGRGFQSAEQVGYDTRRRCRECLK